MQLGVGITIASVAISRKPKALMLSGGRILKFFGCSTSRLGGKIFVKTSSQSTSKLSDSKMKDLLEKHTLIKKINYLFWTMLGWGCTYNLLDAGLSRFLALETLTHGASPMGYFKISLEGADPRLGGMGHGSSAGMRKIGDKYLAMQADICMRNSKNFFHLFKDSGPEFKGSMTLSLLSRMNIFNKICPKLHAMLSGIASAGNIPNKVGGVLGFITPTLKFRFTPEQVRSGRFEDDPDYIGLAWRTALPISTKHIGITGSILQGIGQGTISRMRAHPLKVLRGMALLGAAVWVGKRTYSYMKSKQEKTNKMDQEQTIFQKCKKIGQAAGLAFTGICLNIL
jgi:hypothetical protein